MKIAIRRISLGSLGKLGCVLGAVLALLPSLACGLLVVGLSNLVLNWLASWQELNISLLGQEIAKIDLTQFLGLEELVDLLQTVTALSGPLLLVLLALLALASGAILALIIILLGLVYNLLARVTGGLVVEMNAGQMVEDVRLGVGQWVPVDFLGHTGGVVPMPEEIILRLKELNAWVDPLATSLEMWPEFA